MTQLQVSKCLSTQQSEIRWKMSWQPRLVTDSAFEDTYVYSWYRLCPVVPSVSCGTVCVLWYCLRPVEPGDFVVFIHRHRSCHSWEI